MALPKKNQVLRREMEKTLNSARRDYGFLASLLFYGMDFFYGRERNLSKFKVLEIIARVPYQAWEHVAYIAITHTFETPHFARRIFEFVRESREQQDNEQWHLLILEELVFKKKFSQNFWLHRVLPQFMAFFYYHVSWLLYVIQPSLSYSLNADFEDHAEHEYMLFVSEHLEFESEAYRGDFSKDYGSFNSLTELFIQIGLDERHHKEESLARMKEPRFR